MGFDRKFGVVTTERGNIPRDEPVFVIRAADVAAAEAIDGYAAAAAAVGADEALLGPVRERARQVREWQCAHPERVKVPDTAPGQIRDDEAVG